VIPCLRLGEDTGSSISSLSRYGWYIFGILHLDILRTLALRYRWHARYGAWRREGCCLALGAEGIRHQFSNVVILFRQEAVTLYAGM